MLKMENITMKGTRTLYSLIMDGLKMENINEEINFLAGMGLILIAVTINLVISIFILKKVVV